jgi:putative ABC transport system permease protein
MFKNYLTVAWRNIRKSKAYSALNILGLAVGMAVFILIMLFVRYELSFDRYHENGRNIYRVVQEQPGNYYLGSNLFAVTPGPLAGAMVQDFPEVLEATRIDDGGMSLSVPARRPSWRIRFTGPIPKPSRSSPSLLSAATGPPP